MTRFWAVGVGPGDPDLLTLKAARLIQQAGAIYHAGPRPDQGRAWDVVASLVRPGVAVGCVLDAPMADVDPVRWRDAYRPGVERILADCRRGLDVVFVTEGDATLYSTAACVWQLLAELDPELSIQVVPGVSSIAAAAARVGWPLAQKEQPFVVVPASYHTGRLRRWLDEFPSVCFLKPTRSLPELREAVAEAGCEAVYVENVGVAGKEWISRDLAAAVERAQYFSLVLVRRTDAPRKTPGGVTVVGLGPGNHDQLTEAARTALRSADVVVGYDGYLRPLAALGLRAALLGSPIGAEAARARQALDLAQRGQRVALVSSGDAGVYGMAGLLLESAAETPDVSVEVAPGVTAAVAAAALLGAPLGHDWACVSLSDLLTPWPIIEARLDAVGRGDFVLAVYNPISERRNWQLPRSREILLQYRRPDTPVGLVEKAYRPGQRVWHTTLGDLTTAGVTMETTLIVGSSTTRVVNGRMVTPRGYKATQPHPPAPSPEREGGERQNPPSGSPSPLRGGGWGVGLHLGQRILEESFALIEAELGPHDLPPWAFAVVRRMIHATADFEFAAILRYSPDFADAFRQALQTGMTVVTDTEMVAEGVRTAVGRVTGAKLACCLNDLETPALAETAGLTRSAAGIRVAARKYPAPILVIGNAPTALEEAVRLIEQDGWRPTAIIGMPVGFVGVCEAKSRLLGQTRVPYLSCEGRKGGSAVAAAAFNAMLE